MSKKIISILVILGVLFTISIYKYIPKTNEVDNTAINNSLIGKNYDVARTSILNAGWQPWTGICDEDSLCIEYPEISNCSMSVPVNCDMHFTQKDQCLVILTKGEAPPIAIVDNVILAKAPCGLE